MSEFEKLFDVVKSTAVNEYKKMWGNKLAEMHDVALEQMKPIFKAVYVEGDKSKQAEINDLKQQLSEDHASRASWVEYSQKIESGEFMLVAKKDLTTWYFNEAECLWLEEADNFLYEIEGGQVFTVQRQHNFSLPEVYVARPYSEVEQDADHYQEYATREEAEEVAKHCKAMIEAGEAK